MTLATRSPRVAARATRPASRAASTSGASLVMAVLAGLAYMGALTAVLTAPGADVWAAVIVSVLLLLLSAPIVRRMVGDQAPAVRTLVVSALVLKFAGSLYRYAVAFELYDGVADAERYHNAGRVLAAAFRGGDYNLGEGSLVGTRFIEVVTGVVYAVTGTSRIVGFLVFAWLSFWGLVWFYKAFRTAVPNGQHKLYGYLVLLLPSLIFWPSSIGKEAWMVCMLGLAAYGAAKYFAHESGALIRLALGLWGAAMVRPHVVLLLLAGLAVGVVFRPRRRGHSLADTFAPILRVVVVVAIAVGFVAAMGSSEERFGVGEEQRADSLGGVRDYANEQTEQGGSSFEAQPVRTPLDFPGGMVAVLYRPFLWEAGNAQTTISAIEGTALLLLTLRRWRTVWDAAKQWKSLPYIGLSGVFIVGFVWGFSSFGNFGILVRQRVQVYPFVLAILCCPRLPVATQRGRTRPRPASRRPPRPRHEPLRRPNPIALADG